MTHWTQTLHDVLIALKIIKMHKNVELDTNLSFGVPSTRITISFYYDWPNVLK